MTQIDYPIDEPPQAFIRSASLNYVWDINTLSAVKETQPTGGGGGGAVTIADGADVAQGLTSDAAWVSGSGTVISLLKKIAGFAGLTDTQLRATAVPVSGTFFQATQPVSAAALPLPSGASTEATLSSLNGKVTAVNTGAVVIASGTVTSITNPVSTKTDLTPSAPTSATVGVSSAQAVAANASRKGLALVNVSNARISLGLGSAAVLDSGITLYPGGSFEMDEFTFDLGAVNAIASAAASPLAIQEFA